jgi:hypothetical protein
MTKDAMTETEWRTSADPRVLVSFVAGLDAPPGSVLPMVWASERKLRLFLTTCCRRRWEFVTDAECRRVIAVAERFAEGQASPDELAEAERAASTSLDNVPFESGSADDAESPETLYHLARAARTCCGTFSHLTRQHTYYGRSRDFVAVSPGPPHDSRL